MVFFWALTPVVLGLALSSFFLWDAGIAYWMQANVGPTAHYIAGWLSEAGLGIYLYIPSFFLILALRKKPSSLLNVAVYIFAAAVLSAITINSIKLFAGRSRPEELLFHGTATFRGFGFSGFNSSLPSGHSGTSIGFAACIWALFPNRRLQCILVTLLAVGIAASRIVLCAHYLSDVLIGSWLGIFSAIYLAGPGKYWLSHPLLLKFVPGLRKQG